MPRMRTIFIDFGNVLGFFDHSRAVAQLVGHSPLDADALDHAVYGGQAMDDYESGRLSTAEFFEISRVAGQLTCTQAEFVRAFSDIFTRNDHVCELIPTLARRYRLVLASNTCDAHYLRYSEDFADVLAHFSALCTSHEAKARKPLAAYYDYCQLQAQAAPTECLFLDDLSRNVSAAEAHGWRGLLYHPRLDLPAELRAAGIVLD